MYHATITIDGGIQDAEPPEVVITPAPKRSGSPAFTIAGIRIDPIATTVAGEDPDTAANSAQASTPARPQAAVPVCPTIELALIIRRATPPCVREVAGQDEERDRHDLEISMPVNSFQRHRFGHARHRVDEGQHGSGRAIEIGMPVSINRDQQAEEMTGSSWLSPPPHRCWDGVSTSRMGSILHPAAHR